MSIHPTAIIDSTAKLGPGVSIGPYAIVGPHCEIGRNSKILSHAVMEYTTLGEDCLVYPYASLGLTPQHLGYKNEPTVLVVGDRTVFREGVVAHRGTKFDQGKTIIGNDCYFMATSHIAHDCVIGNNVILANAALLAGHVKVGDRCFISSTVGIHQFVRIGSLAMISGGAMVSLDVAPFTIAQGDRASLRGLNLVGMKRAGLTRINIKLVKEAYKTVFLSGLSLKEALLSEALNINDPQVGVFKSFFLEPKRGFTRAAGLVSDHVDEVDNE